MSDQVVTRRVVATPWRDRGVRRVRTLATLLDAELVAAPLIGALPADVMAIAGWGHKPSGRRAAALAARHGLVCLRLEDGFLRSVGLGDQAPPLSIVVDDSSIYYDATTASRLETQIAGVHHRDALVRAGALRARWCEARVSKYNHARDAVPAVAGDYVLVVDQTYGDASITYGMADATSFTRMLGAALDEHPGLPVVLKVHPDVIAGRKRGHFAALSAGEAARVTVMADDAHLPSLLDRAAAVYTVTSQVGFEALMWQRPVRCFGMPFYAGWGLTHDESTAPARRQGRGVTLDALVDAALVMYARYVDPETGRRCEVERLIDHLDLQRRARGRFPARVEAVAFSRWKQPIARAFFGGSQVHFVDQDAPIEPGATVAVWGRKPAPAAGAVIRVEDGFIRSVGLGAELTKPLSWVQDDLGIYFDATQASRLEVTLLNHVFDAPLVARARRLRESLVAAGITKYNVGAATWTPPHDRARKLVLVPGQVESDASIAFGGGAIRSNLGLLRAARDASPGAYVIYKPHPDVMAGLRDAASPTHATLAACLELCDEVVVDVPMGRLLDAVDEVHVLTSLAGFEGLLRGKRVVTWGLPFYAGWGLTDDRAPADSPAFARRTRKLQLDELVAATLILYPTYVSGTSGEFTTPERALEELVAWRQGAVSRPAAAWPPSKRWALALAARMRGA